ncbi:DoxX family protein [Streptomyces sp. NPDC059161]|uniref:DoxX family protein n=1 Tax=Streptomyces sp. NPDC059161 TaxID=3346749 RepID=UPI0036C14216
MGQDTCPRQRHLQDLQRSRVPVPIRVRQHVRRHVHHLAPVGEGDCNHSIERVQIFRQADPWLIQRVTTRSAHLFACHGAASLFGVLGGPHGAGTVPTLQRPGWWAALIELVGGALVALGLFTRTSAVICSGAMAYAYFTAHQPNALFPIDNGGEPAVLSAGRSCSSPVRGSAPTESRRS